MQRINQALFAISILAICWLGMMAVHELGHVIGALLTGGVVQQVVLHPLAISRTDVGPNPNPAMVVWFGPIFGAMAPVIAWLLIPRSRTIARNITGFFAGFCLITNGAYIGIGSFEGVGDCREMLRTGSPFWLLLLFGVVAITAGLLFWHRLGSLREFLSDPATPDRRVSWVVFGGLVTIVILELLFSPR